MQGVDRDMQGIQGKQGRQGIQGKQGRQGIQGKQSRQGIHRHHASRITFYVLLFIILTGCSAIPRFWEREVESPVPDPNLTPTLQTPTAGAAATAVPTSSAPQTTTLKIWVPPEFDPQGDTPAGELLKVGLDEFDARRSRVEVEVRVKALSGGGGMLTSLRTAQAAAPLALPDLVLLSRPLLEEAAEDDLIFPLDEITNTMADDNWYEYARQLSQYQEETVGVPFAGDVLLMAYRSDLFEEAPADWEKVLATEGVLTFPASAPEALTTFALYHGAGGTFATEEGEVLFDTSPFLEVLSFYQQGWAAEVIPYWLTQFETESQAWEAYQKNQAQLAFVWSSRYLNLLPADTALTSIPSQDGKAFTIANGWLWSVASTDPARQALSVELAEFLTTNSFVADWTSAAGYVPPRPEALESWAGEEEWGVLEQVLPSSQILPSQLVLDKLGPRVRDAVVSVLKDQITPEEALLIINGEGEAQQ
ncbi:MAG: hypothetical protein MAG431_00340 [Chloroflexi bacterium]|nr:hypothetical protein [Chloroflexota bacterium]